MTNTLATAGQFIVAIFGAGTVGGLVSGELSRLLAAREKRRQHLARLLAELLEVRRLLISNSQVKIALSGVFPADVNIEIALPAVMGLFFNPQQLHERYEAAVNELASLDPLLAYRLRSQDLLPSLAALVSQIGVTDPLARQIAPDVNRILSSSGRAALDNAALRVARGLGRNIFRETRQVLREQTETQDGSSEIIDILRQKMPELSAIAAGGPSKARTAGSQSDARCAASSREIGQFRVRRCGQQQL